MLIKVYLHGYMKDFHDGPIEVHAETAGDAISKVTRQLPGFAPDPVRGRHRIAVLGFDNEDDFHKSLRDVTELHVMPQFNGGKNGGLLQILLGVALVAVGYFTFGATSWLGSMLMKVGAIAALGGIAAMLAPTPEEDTSEQKQSGYLGAPKNTTQIGTRIPILYGEHQVFGHILSFDINALEFEVKENEDDD